MKKMLMSLGVAAAISASGLAHANLFNGKELNFAINYPAMDSTTSEVLNGTYLVGPGTEINVPGVAFIDFSDTNLLGIYGSSFTFASHPFVGYVFSDANGDIDSFASVAINPLTSVAGFDASRITFDDDHIWVNMTGLTVQAGDALSFDVSAVAAVPEPETYAMFLAGLGLIGGVARRRFR
ncbi:PEP-CTERM sorting domain-containing protein [Nitrogeniibacter aestuarii]|uniref:PEP-CTERM sorting domain-containing protein n=1 Tax=Nitrogeniibacter aestuarii TaxID=2815343 RepID=UPI001D10DA34|nr:PEP-CTERM sorting domain-containing protein [Nitrogeniibacter aestuarii]